MELTREQLAVLPADWREYYVDEVEGVEERFFDQRHVMELLGLWTGEMLARQRDRQRLRRVLAMAKDERCFKEWFLEMGRTHQGRAIKRGQWAAAWKAAAKKWYITRPLRAAQKEIIEELTAKRDELAAKVEEAWEILATERLPLSAGAHLKLAAVLREEE